MSNRPWAFIGGGGRFIWVHQSQIGWTEQRPTKSVRKAYDKHEGHNTYAYMLDKLAQLHENGDDIIKCCTFNWGRAMIPVFEDEQIMWTFNKKDIENGYARQSEPVHKSWR